jgi:quercetin dioxygenase-like cupin family protein
MKRTTLALTVALAAFAGMPAFGPAKAAAQDQGTIETAFQHAIPNIPGKTLTGVVVNYPPGAKSPAHDHAKSAFITAYVLSGAMRSPVNGGAIRGYHAGESWTEPPGAHHNISENASTTEPASLLAIFVADSDEKELTTFPKK